MTKVEIAGVSGGMLAIISSAITGNSIPYILGVVCFVFAFGAYLGRKT